VKEGNVSDKPRAPRALRAKVSDTAAQQGGEGALVVGLSLRKRDSDNVIMRLQM